MCPRLPVPCFKDSRARAVQSLALLLPRAHLNNSRQFTSLLHKRQNPGNEVESLLQCRARKEVIPPRARALYGVIEEKFYMVLLVRIVEVSSQFFLNQKDLL